MSRPALVTFVSVRYRPQKNGMVAKVGSRPAGTSVHQPGSAHLWRPGPVMIVSGLL